MTLSKRAEKRVGLLLFYIIAILLICAYVSNEVPSYEIRGLHGYRWILFWSLAFYLPVFPLVSILLAMPTAFRPIGIIATQAIITMCFTLFAWVLEFQFLSWTFLLLANLVLLSCLLFDKRKKQNE